MILTNKIYDILKWITLILFPALAVLYVALADIWGLPYPIEVAGTIGAIDLFLAMVLGISTNTFKIHNPMYRLNLIKLAGDIEDHWIMPTNVYEILTFVAQILLPAFITLYTALAGLWNLPYVDQVVGTLVALDAFLGLLLGFSNSQFHKKAITEVVGEPNLQIEQTPPMG